jgi:hypothetical protein
MRLDRSQRQTDEWIAHGDSHHLVVFPMDSDSLTRIDSIVVSFPHTPQAAIIGGTVVVYGPANDCVCACQCSAVLFISLFKMYMYMYE